MNYFRYQGHTLASEEALPYEPLAALPGEGEVLFCRGLEENTLAPGGVCIRRTKE